VPGELGAATNPARVLRAPADGIVEARAAIGDRVELGQVVAEVAGAAVRAGCAGVLRGLIHPGVYVAAGMKIGDVDPRGARDHCFAISDKSLAIAGGVLEAILVGLGKPHRRGANS